MEAIKKIDIHAHSMIDPQSTPSTIAISPEDLIAMYDELGVEKGVLLPIVSPEGLDCTLTNEMIQSIVAAHPDRFVWFCNVDPRAGRNSATTDLSKLLNFYKERGAKGLGELTSNLYFDDPKMDNLFSHCEECNMPIIFHISPMLGGFYGVADDLGLPRLEKMLKKHPNLSFIGHSQPFWAEMSSDVTVDNRNGYPTGKVTEGRLPKLMREYGNLHCDLSAGSGANSMTRDRENAVSFLNEFADRIFYGCDICRPGATFPYDFRDFLDSLRASGELKEENYRKICRENAVKLLGLN